MHTMTLYICEFCNSDFNQSQIESIGKKSLGSSEKQSLKLPHTGQLFKQYAHVFTTIYITNVQAGFKKGRGTRDQIANILWIVQKAREFQKNIYFCFIDYAKAFDCVDNNKPQNILKDMGIPDHLTCHLRNL